MEAPDPGRAEGPGDIIACTLTNKQAEQQLSEWEQTRGHATKTVTVDGGVQMTFPPHLVGQLQDLAAREMACCSFLTIAVSATETEATLCITAETKDGQGVISLLAGRPTT